VAYQHHVLQLLVGDRFDQAFPDSGEVDPGAIHLAILRTPQCRSEDPVPAIPQGRRHGIPAPGTLPAAMNKNKLH
jgi:hypothetical protein